MRRKLALTLAAASAATVLACGSPAAWAQSGTRTPTAQNQGSAPGAQGHAALALEGYCPVCITDMSKWVKGNPQYQTTYDGRIYYFPGSKQKEAFLANPAKYVPALGGDCAVCLAKMGKRVPGDIRHAMFHQGRLFLFASEAQKKMFAANPKAFENVDLADGGNCVVCKVEMHKTMPGKADFAVYHDGLRYLFPSAQMQAMFLANPKKYEVSSQ